MKVVLINPGIGKYNDSPPINLAILASYLRQFGHEIKIIDKLSGGNFDDLEKFQPDFAGITGTTPVITDAYRCADKCREMGIWTVLGGVHTSILPEESLKHADTVITGEGEITLKELIANPRKGIISGKPTIDLDSIPIPAFDLLNMEFYLTVLKRVEMSFMSFTSHDKKIACLLTSRGCPYNCLFCHNSYRTLPYRCNSPKRVLKEIKYFLDKYNVDGFFFVEDNLFCNHSRLRKICELIKKEKLDIVWGANSRVDNINSKILKMAKSAGCKQVTFGWESGSQRILDILNKRTTIEQNIKSVKLCNIVGIKASGTVMIGNPTETEEDIKLTQRFLTENDITGPIGVCITTPYPGTGLWKWCEENKKIPKDFRWEDFDFHHVPIHMADIPLGRFLELANETIRIAIDKFNMEKQFKAI